MKVRKLHPYAKLPTRADSGSNGYDLYASEDVFIPIGETGIIPTGISIEMEESRWDHEMSVFKIEDRSSMAIKGLRTGAGVVDNSYRGEIKVVMHNLNNLSTKRYRSSDGVFIGTGYEVRKGDKIAQALIYKTSTEEVEEVDELEESERGSNGFGSTGV